MLLAGQSMEGCGQVIEEEKAVAQSLFNYYRRVPQIARYVQIGLDAAALPISADCERAAQKLLMVRVDLK